MRLKSVHFVSEITKQMILQETQQDHTWLVGIQATICIKNHGHIVCHRVLSNSIKKASRKTLSAWTTELKKKNKRNRHLPNKHNIQPKDIGFFGGADFGIQKHKP